MNSKQRRGLVLEALRTGQLDVNVLSKRYDVSLSTIRRDLKVLAQKGYIKRTFGGALLNENCTETTISERLDLEQEKKAAIGKYAAGLIQENMTVILDAGTTTCALAQYLVQRNIRIITNNLMALHILDDAPHIELLVIGGQCRKSSMGTYGPLAIKTIEDLTADFLFTSGDGLDAERGLCEGSLEQIAIKSHMMKSAKQVVVLADSTKIGALSQHAWIKPPQGYTLICDEFMAPKDQQRFKDHGANLITVAL